MTAPIREAFVVAEPGDPPRSVAGVPLLVHTSLVLERAGIERLTVIGAGPPADPRIHVRLGAAPAVRAAADGMLRLVVGPGAVIDAALVHDLQARAPAGRVLELEHQGARVRVAPGALVATTDGTPAAPRAGVLLPATAPAPVLERALLRGPALALRGVGVLASFAVISWSEHAESRRHRAGGWENRVLDGVLAPLSTRDWYFLVVPFVLAGRLDWLVLGAAIGSQVFWVAALVLLVSVLRRAPG